MHRVERTTAVAPTTAATTLNPVAPETPAARVAPFQPLTSSPTSPAPNPDFRFFSPTSVWNQPLADNAPVDPNSAAITGHLEAYVNAGLASRSGPWINTYQYSTPIYTVPAAQPTVPVIMDYNNASLSAALSAVPIPEDAQPAAGTDAEMTVYQPSSDTLWEMFDMRQALAAPPFLSGVVGSGGSLPGGATTTSSPR